MEEIKNKIVLYLDKQNNELIINTSLSKEQVAQHYILSVLKEKQFEELISQKAKILYDAYFNSQD